MRARLVTIPFSHYCEKARWALDRAGIEYIEEPHLPMFAWVPALRTGKRRTVPVLLADEEVVTDSHDILAWVDRKTPELHLYPKDIAAEVEALEAVFDKKVGPATRRLAYHVILGNRRVTADLFAREGPRWESVAARALLPVMARMMKRGLKIDDAGAERSRAQLEPVLADVEARLSKSGGPWLFGDRFTAADLTFAALMTPAVAPPSFADAHFGSALLDFDEARTLVGKFRETPAGQFALRAYDDARTVRIAI